MFKRHFVITLSRVLQSAFFFFEQTINQGKMRY